MKHDNRRLPSPWGCLIDRQKSVSIRFDGRCYSGYQGDTIASLLAASGRLLISRSFKYHRPRAVLSMAGHDANSLVRVADEPNVRSDLQCVLDGMDVQGQNFIGSLDHDWGACMGWLARFMPVGFYYKAFFRPHGAWMWWEKLVRRIAGVGKVDLRSVRQKHYKRFMFADVAVLGGGPGGLSAAIQVARSGAEVVLVDNQPLLGGALRFARFDSEGKRGCELAEELTKQVANTPRVTTLSATTCTGWFSDNLLSLIAPKGLIKLRAHTVVAATGVIEQPAVFRNNDLPGVMLGSAAQRLLRFYAVKPGTRAVVLTTNGDGYAVALDLFDAGIEVAAIVDLRATPKATEMFAAACKHDIKVITGAMVYEALASRGNRSVVGVEIAKIRGSDNRYQYDIDASSRERIACDLVCMSTGYIPAAQLLCHSGGRLIYDETAETLVVDQLPNGGRGVIAAGSVKNVHGLDATIADGKMAGWKASIMAGFEGGENPSSTPSSADTVSEVTDNVFPVPIFPHPKGKEFVDFDEDVQVKDILDAVGDGYDDLELTKRYTTAVMGPSQGRHSALNTLQLVCRARSTTPAKHTVTTQRPPFFAERLEYLAGVPFEPVRFTAMYHRHLELGGRMQPVGLWMRPAFYGNPSQEKALIQGEALNVRNNVGIIDVSTLGKLEIRGSDAAEFINRMYTFAYAKQPVGRVRYTLMTDEGGTIIDDGVACRWGEQHFYLTATTSGVDGVYRAMLRKNAEWGLDVDIVNVTSTYAAVNIAGPNSRKVLQNLVKDVDLSPEAFPYLGAREGYVANIPARLMRIGFVGELGFEVHVPCGCGEALWDALMVAGKRFHIKPFGVEAQRLLRLEKGHIIINQDTDGLTFPHEVDMTWALATKKPFFIGKRPIAIRAERMLERILVGFHLPAGSPMPEECNITVRNDDIIGYVTSVAFSSTLGKTLGLAFVSPQQKEHGSTFDIKLSNADLVQASVVPVPFYDPETKRQEL